MCASLTGLWNLTHFLVPWRWFRNIILSLWFSFFYHWHSAVTALKLFDIFVGVVIICAAGQVCRSSHCCLRSGYCSTTLFSWHSCASLCCNLLSLFIRFGHHWPSRSSRCSSSALPHWVSRDCRRLGSISSGLNNSTVSHWGGRLVDFGLLVIIWWSNTLDTKLSNFYWWSLPIRDNIWRLLWLNLIAVGLLYHKLLILIVTLIRPMVSKNLIHSFVLWRIFLYVLVLVLGLAS